METAVTESQGRLDSERMAELCRALGHPARIRILQLLKRTNKCICGKIVASMPLAQSTVSQHLKQLKSAGLVKGEIEGPHTCYCLNHEQLDQLKQFIANL